MVPESQCDKLVVPFRFGSSYAVFADPVLVQIADEAQRLTGGKCTIRVHGDATPALVIELPGDSIVRGRLLHKRLTEFCGREGLSRRFLVVGSTQPKFIPKTPSVPDGWPVDPEP